MRGSVVRWIFSTTVTNHPPVPAPRPPPVFSLTNLTRSSMERPPEYLQRCVRGGTRHLPTSRNSLLGLGLALGEKLERGEARDGETAANVPLRVGIHLHCLSGGLGASIHKTTQTLAMMTLLTWENASPSCSHTGARFLQWPHPARGSRQSGRKKERAKTYKERRTR